MRLLAVVLLVILFFLAPGLNHAEARQLWVVRDELSIRAAPADALRAARANVTDMLNRMEGQPVYTVVLDAWVMLTGDSVLAARALSLLCVLFAGVVLLRLYPVSPFLLVLLLAYPAVQISSLGVLVLLVALSTWIIINKPPTLLWLVLYAGLLVVAVSTSLAALILLLVHYMIVGRSRWIVPLGAALLVGLPQIFLWREDAVSLVVGVVLILLLTPPGGLASATLPRFGEGKNTNLIFRRINPWGIAAVIFAVYGGLLVMRPDWQEVANTLNTMRTSTEPTIIMYPPQHPLAYYNPPQGITVDLGWRDFAADEVDRVLKAVDRAPVVWVLADQPEILGTNYTPGYALAAGDLEIVRYDRNE